MLLARVGLVGCLLSLDWVGGWCLLVLVLVLVLGVWVVGGVVEMGEGREGKG